MGAPHILVHRNDVASLIVVIDPDMPGHPEVEREHVALIYRIASVITERFKSSFLPVVDGYSVRIDLDPHEQESAAQQVTSVLESHGWLVLNADEGPWCCSKCGATSDAVDLVDVRGGMLCKGGCK